MRAYKDEEGWLKWVQHHLDRFEEMKDNGLDIQEVWPNDIVSGEFDRFPELIEKWAGLSWNEREIQEFITPELYHTDG